jgi:hypothetical protein
VEANIGAGKAAASMRREEQKGNIIEPDKMTMTSAATKKMKSLVATERHTWIKG